MLAIFPATDVSCTHGTASNKWLKVRPLECIAYLILKNGFRYIVSSQNVSVALALYRGFCKLNGKLGAIPLPLVASVPI
jgi:hypothetical protein